MNHPILSAKQISKKFLHPISVEILKEVSLDLYPGESVAIMGASGEGKSTLLQILGTLEQATSGSLYILGEQVEKKNCFEIRNRHIGFVFQAFHLLEELTALENVLMPAFISGLPIHKKSDAYQRGCALLEKVGLQERVHFSTKLLSGGEKQRVALARAFCNDPKIIFADEPSGNLDHTTSAEIHSLLIQEVKENNKSLVVVTHDPSLAALCERTLTLSGGKLENRSR